MIYAPAPSFLLRAPLLPVEDYLDLDPERLLSDPRVRTALQVGSPSLAEALARPGPPAEPGSAPPARAERSLRRYLIRLSTRPTPYGLFAAAALGRWGGSTTLALGAGRRTRTRPDMGWLLGKVQEWEQEGAVRPHLRLSANPAVLVRAGRAFLGERTRFREGQAEPEVSVRATRLLREVLARTRQPVAWEELRDGLGGPPDRVEAFLHELLDATLLLSDLRPSLTHPEPARQVLARLRGIPPLAAEAEGLGRLLEACAAWDRGEGRYEALEHPVQVDSALDLAGRDLHGEVGREVARAAELLLRLTPFPRGLPYLRDYRSRFVARYGPDREVPLLEMLDPVLGLGPPAAGAAESPGRRERALVDLAARALHRRDRVLELDEEVLARLETWRPGPEAPSSLDLCALVAARDRSSLDAGEFLVIVGPNLGAEEAGRNLGRFAGLLGEDLDDLLDGLARHEEEVRPGTLRADLSYLPRKLRSANVVVRRGRAEREVALGVGASAPGLPLDELWVGVGGGRFYVRWQDREVVPALGHMLNDRHASPAFQFLARHRRDGGPQLHPFDWGPAWGFPYLPRVASGRVVLLPARWRLSRADLPLARWREEWDVPRFVHVGQGDVRLLLDLDDPLQAGELEAQAERSREAVVYEALPDPGQAWLPGPGGRYVCELVVPLRGPSSPRPPRAPAPSPPPRARRLFPPGSEWTFLKLYTAPDAEDELLAGPLRPLLQEGSFFMRYSDPEPHLRLRVPGGDERLAPLARAGLDLLEAGLVTRVAFDTYERETERYGGDAGIEAAEAIFVADSRLVLDVLDRRFRILERPVLGTLTVTFLLEALGLADLLLLHWRVARRDCREAARATYRERGRELLHMHRSPGDLGPALEAHRPVLASCGFRLSSAALERPLAQVADDLVHMHLNRLLGRDRSVERQVLGLAMRLAEARRARQGGG